MIVSGSLYFNVAVAKSKIHGKGVFAKEGIPAKKKVGSLAGVVISKRAARMKAKGKHSIAIVELWDGNALDASEKSNELKYINHSCQPNTYMRTLKHHVEFYTLRNIKRDEELTCNYGETHHNGKRKCDCGAPGCKGYL
jgi:uncharacterized protein